MPFDMSMANCTKIEDRHAEVRRLAREWQPGGRRQRRSAPVARRPVLLRGSSSRRRSCVLRQITAPDDAVAQCVPFAEGGVPAGAVDANGPLSSVRCDVALLGAGTVRLSWGIGLSLSPIGAEPVAGGTVGVPDALAPLSGMPAPPVLVFGEVTVLEAVVSPALKVP